MKGWLKARSLVQRLTFINCLCILILAVLLWYSMYYSMQRTAVQTREREAELRASQTVTQAERTAELCNMSTQVNHLMGLTTDVETSSMGHAQTYLDRLEKWLAGFCTRLAQEFADFENKQKIRQAVNYLHQHFREPINMAMVSNDVSMNYLIFSVLFKQYTDVNFVSYLQDMRVKEAARLLETTDWRVGEIGRRSGFADEKHFMKVFKASAGFSPTEYRRAKRLTEMQNDGD